MNSLTGNRIHDWPQTAAWENGADRACSRFGPNPVDETMRYLVAGIWMVVRDRRLWPYIAKPMLLGAVVYAVAIAVGFLSLVPIMDWLSGWFGIQSDWLRNLSRGLGFVLFGLAVFFFSGIFYLILSSIFSAFLWEKLAIEVERRLGSPAPAPKHPLAVIAADSVVRMALAVLVGIATLLLGWTCFGIVGVLGAGWLGLHDYTSPAFLRHGRPIWRQAFEVYRCRGWFSFLLGAGILTLAPILNLLFLPGLVAGGTMLHAQRVPSD